MPVTKVISGVGETRLFRLAEDLAFAIKSGDMISLSGDLGAGKTTLARAIIRALGVPEHEEIPSPTFTLLQTYETPRMSVAHFDLYRLSAPSELAELGLDAAVVEGIALVEWPERAGGILPHDRLEVLLEDDGNPDTRRITLTGHGIWEARLERFMAMRDLLAAAGMEAETCSLRYLQGDASVRRYARIACQDSPGAVLMDWARQPDGPAIRNGLPYSRIAHLAEDVRPFVALDSALSNAGFSVPAIKAQNLTQGFLVIEDLGDRVFAHELKTNPGAQRTMWLAATETLVALANVPSPETVPLGDNGEPHRIPTYDQGALGIEIELLVDWYWRRIHDSPAPESVRAEYLSLWESLLNRICALPTAWVLRDYHSPNLLWLPEREGIARVGIIDFQDAMRGPAAYDLVSLLQDARVDVAPELEAECLDHYRAAVASRQPEFDRDTFDFAYAALGAQRNTKILGIFARLAMRDGKPGYLHHNPRLWRYLERDLAHPELADLKSWYDHHMPARARETLPA